MDLVDEFREFEVEGDWNLVWNLHIPPKVRVFLWKACRDYLSTRIRLQNRGISCPVACVFCSDAIESYWNCVFYLS